MINPLVDELAVHTGVKTACALLGRARGSHYRAKAPRPVRDSAPRPAPPAATAKPAAPRKSAAEDDWEEF